MTWSMDDTFPNPTYESALQSDLGMVVTQMDSGTRRARRRFTHWRETGTLVWVLTTAERNAFLREARRYVPDTMQVPFVPDDEAGDEQVVPRLVRFMSEITSEAMGWNAYRVSVSVDVLN